jgi:type III restriction enzyme
MIKLPMNIMSSGLSKWEDCLDKARVKRNELAELAAKAYVEEGRYVRPIVLVQVERTGADQRGKGPVHSEDVREYLIEKCAVPARAIAVKSSSKDEIEDAPLLDEGCPIEYIITKQALQEGWDCPFAYILVSLNEAGSKLAMTQLIGRVLRQPDQTQFKEEGLNESYVYCLHRSAAELGREVKSALEKEGYEGDGPMVRTLEKAAPSSEKKQVAIQERFRNLYKDFDGTIYLPYFCVRDGDRIKRLNYYDHLLRSVDPRDFDFSPLAVDISEDAAKEDYYRATLGQKELDHVDEWDAEPTETPEEVRSWLVANLDFAYFSFRQLRALVAKALDVLSEKNPNLNELLPKAKYSIRDRIKEQIERQITQRAKSVFDRLYDEGRLVFFLEKKEGRYRIPKETRIRVTRPLHHSNGNTVAKNLFDYVDEGGMNEYEKSVALYLDSHPEILWWFRNRVGPEHFMVQGWEERRIYPDFIAARGDAAYPEFVYVVESKGKQLKGTDDTVYKEEVASVFERLGQKVSWEDLGEQFSDRVFRFQVVDQGRYDHNWQDRIASMVEP